MQGYSSNEDCVSGEQICRTMIRSLFSSKPHASYCACPSQYLGQLGPQCTAVGWFAQAAIFCFNAVVIYTLGAWVTFAYVEWNQLRKCVQINNNATAKLAQRVSEPVFLVCFSMRYYLIIHARDSVLWQQPIRFFSVVVCEEIIMFTIVVMLTLIRTRRKREFFMHCYLYLREAVVICAATLSYVAIFGIETAEIAMMAVLVTSWLAIIAIHVVVLHVVQEAEAN